MDKNEWRQSKEVGIAVELCGLKDGCHASVGALMRVANANSPPREPVIGSQSTFGRAFNRLKKRGIADSKRISQGPGRCGCFRWNIRSKLDELANATRNDATTQRKKPEEYQSPDRLMTDSRSIDDGLTPYNKPLQTSLTCKSTWSSSTVDDDQKCNWSEEEISRVRVEANRIVRKIGGCRNAGDRSLLCKSIYLAGRVYSENWLRDAVEGTAIRKANPTKAKLLKPFAWLQRLLGEGAEREGKQLNQQLAQVTVPPELLEPRQRAKAVDLTERMCGTGREDR